MILQAVGERETLFPRVRLPEAPSPPRSLLARVGLVAGSTAMELAGGSWIVCVSRTWEPVCVQIAALLFSSAGTLSWLLKLEQKRESSNSCCFSLVGGG